MAENTNKIPSFKYEGVDRKGFKAKGDISAKNIALAKIALRKQGITVRKIHKKQEIKFLKDFLKPKISTMDITIFARQLVTMIKAGVPLVQGFDIVAEGLDNPSMRHIVLGIKADIEKGNTFAQGLSKYPQYFDELFCALVASGEQSGALEQMLERVALYKEKNELLKQKIRKALKYPITVIVIAVIVSIILMLKVVPIFQDLFSSFGAELPALTRMVVDLSKWMQSYWLLLIGILAICIFIFLHFKKNNKPFQNFLDRISLKLPILGPLIFKSIVARFSRTLATTFAAGVPLIDALESTAAATNNFVFEKAVLKIREDVSNGQQLQFAMRQARLFPTMAIQLVAIGEESGTLESMLEKVAIYYENEVDHAVDGLTSMMEPFIMATLGILVGGLVIAMYLPIFQMGSIV